MQHDYCCRSSCAPAAPQPAANGPRSGLWPIRALLPQGPVTNAAARHRSLQMNATHSAFTDSYSPIRGYLNIRLRAKAHVADFLEPLMIPTIMVLNTVRKKLSAPTTLASQVLRAAAPSRPGTCPVRTLFDFRATSCSCQYLSTVEIRICSWNINSFLPVPILVDTWITTMLRVYKNVPILRRRAYAAAS